jgi:hypothetical protein
MAAAAASSSSVAASKEKKDRRRRGDRSSTMPKNLGFVGARYREWGRWAAELRVPRTRQRLWIGTFATPKQAAHAYDAAVYCFYGENIPKTRKLNFPTAPPPDIPERVRGRLTAANIKAIAEKYAHVLADVYIPPPPVFHEPAPPAVVVDASTGVGAAATANCGNDVNEVGHQDISSIADCLLSFNDEELDQFDVDILGTSENEP